MPNTFRCLLLLLCFIPTITRANPDPSYVKTDNGVIIYPDNPTGSTAAIRLQVISDNIIRVMAAPQKDIPTHQSLVTVYKPGQLPEWNLVPSNDNSSVTLKTRLITAIASLKSGDVTFYDASGSTILAEKKAGREFHQTILEGERTYAITQIFDLSPDDAWYGLGQHQDGLMNYKGKQVLLYQDNTEVAVPFLISNKNYGILWDNNSITKAGDTRDYKPLSSLKLFSKDEEPGWLTATYYIDWNSHAVLMKKAESDISYEYLNDSKLHLPADFNPSRGSIIWEGSIASDVNGMYRLRFTYGGYIRIWIGGRLIADRWRQAWKPGSLIADVNLTAGNRTPIKIEWIPNGGESYISLKCLEPLSESNANTMGFASEAGKELDYYFVYGKNMDEVISGYRQLTGKAAILPSWAYGLWQSRERYKTQDEILTTVNEFRRRQIPLDNIVLDWSYWKVDDWGSQDFDATRFRNPDSMIKVLHDKYHTHFMISVWPKFYEGIKAYNDFDSMGWLYKRNIADRQRDWIGQGYVSTFYDAFNEGARKGFWSLLRNKLYKKGVDGWWLDASEPDILSNATPQKRKEQMYPLAAGLTSEYLNAYPLENARAIYEGQLGDDPNKRAFILTRSAYPGIQRYAAATWSGDISSRWHDMLLQISAGTNFSMSGLPNWSMDIGGFAVEKRYEKPIAEDLDEWRELNARWYQFGTFVPLFRVHGQFPYREIYNVSPEDHECYQSMLYYDKLRYRLMPYIYSLAGMTYHKDYTIMRGLVMDFPNDKNAINNADQYMFGPSLLINPVYNYKQRDRSLYLPAGQGWYDLYRGGWNDGGQTIYADAPYGRIPVFVKAGSILPFGPALQYTNEKKADTITLYVYAGKDGAFSLYEDEGLNYNYEKGVYSTIDFQYSDADSKLTIGKRAGEFPGMLKKRVFRIKYVTKLKAQPLVFDNEGILVRYDGKPQSVSLR